MDVYISTVNGLVSDAISGTSIAEYTSKDVDAALPSAIKNQCIHDSKSIIKKHDAACHRAVLQNRKLIKKGSPVSVKAPRLPVLKKPCCYINNQNFRINCRRIEFPVLVNVKSARISVETIEAEFSGDGNVRGIDLGIKCPAVSYCSDGAVKFYGNGRKNK